MGFLDRIFGPRARPGETLRLTRLVMDMLAEGKSDEAMKQVRRVQRMMRGA